MKKNKDTSLIVIALILLALVARIMLFDSGEEGSNSVKKIFKRNDRSFHLLSSDENRFVDDSFKAYAKKNNIDLEITHMGDLEIIEELNANADEYNGVWISNSLWLYMLDNTSIYSESSSISISPVVLGVRKSKAKELGLIDKKVTNKDILELIKNKQIKYVMPNVLSTNTGATAYLGFLNTLAGSPEVLTTEMLDNEMLAENLVSLFSGVERVSGSETYLEEMFINDKNFEAIITSESSIININKQLSGDNKLYAIYPIDGVPINDSTFAYIKGEDDKKDNYLILKQYLLGKEGQNELLKTGRRTWYGGVNKNADKNIFNPEFGIDTTKYLTSVKYPSKKVINKAISLYLEEFRKPINIVFCLDYSGSMYGEGIDSLTKSMEYLLDSEKSSLDNLQFSKKDKITVIPFETDYKTVWGPYYGNNTSDLIYKIKSKSVGGSTALYGAIEKALDTLKFETDDYNKVVIAMTDGAANVGSFTNLSKYYNNNKLRIPIYSITFGSASERQLQEIATMSNAKVFDGKENLLAAFKEVRNYN